MVDWNNPATIFSEYGAVVKLQHVVGGIYLWEFICNIGFEWSLIRRRRQWRWTATLFIASRLFTVTEVLTFLVGLNITSRFNCELWIRFVTLFSYASTTFSLSLYAIRGVAIWQRSMPVTIISVAVVLANVGAWVRRVIVANGVWSPQAQLCLFEHTHHALLNNGMLLATEIFFIVLMAGGIYTRNPGPRVFKIMFREGLLWLVLASVMQIVPVVFLILNFNDPMNIMFVKPSVIFTSIGATRMYRTLSDRQAGNLLDFWETSRDETTGEIRFRRQTQLVNNRTDGPNGETASTTALPMGRLVRTPQQVAEERYVERFEARDIELDDDSVSIQDVKRSIGTEDDKSSAATATEWVHAK